MILHVHTPPACSDVADSAAEGAAAPHCATAVLQHPGGQVGFDRGQGAAAIQALVRDAVAIELANAPDWTRLTDGAVSSRTLHAQFRRVATCSAPGPALLQALDTVASNKLQARKNDVLARHGKPALAPAPTAFDHWVTENGQLVPSSARWLVGSCETLVLWRFSVWGLYASILADSSAAAVEPVLRAAEELRIAVVRAASQSELPVW
jgi:hypothetical protein